MLRADPRATRDDQIELGAQAVDDAKRLASSMPADAGEELSYKLSRILLVEALLRAVLAGVFFARGLVASEGALVLRLLDTGQYKRLTRLVFRANWRVTVERPLDSLLERARAGDRQALRAFGIWRAWIGDREVVDRYEPLRACWRGSERIEVERGPIGGV